MNTKFGSSLEASSILCTREGSLWKKNESVIVVLKGEDTFVLMSGHVTSSPESHVGVDNINQVVIWGDEAFNPFADSGDDAHERSFEGNNPYLLREAEARLLQHLGFAQQWFIKDGPTKANQICFHLRVHFEEKTLNKVGLSQPGLFGSNFSISALQD